MHILFLGTIYLLTQSVIQTTEGRKNLENNHVYILVDVLEILRFALDDITRVSTSISLPFFWHGLHGFHG